jgi:hypothetical protein
MLPDKAMGRERIQRQIGYENLWNGRIRRDTGCPEQRSVLAARERSAALAFVRGRRWHASRLLQFQEFPSRRLTCQALIRSSYRLLEESRHAILRTKAILAFSGVRKRLVN